MTKSDSQQNSSILKKALLFLNQQGLTATPTNYAVAYAYASDENLELVEAVTKALESKGQAITNELFDQLYERYLLPAEFKEVESIRQTLGALLSTSSEHLNQGKEHTQAFHDALTDGVAKLDSESSHAQRNSLLQELAEQTRAMVNHTQQLQDRLDHTCSEVDMLRHELDKMSVEASKDPLTGLFNRRAFTKALEQNGSDSEETYSIIMSDIDFFKKFNDSFGHRMGDNVLCYVANKLQKCTKGKDVVARYGGEEFILLLPDTELSGATILAENIRKTIGSSRIMQAGTNEVVGRITISCGVAQLRSGEHPEDVIARADAALYAAKNGGRDCVRSETDLSDKQEKIGEPVKISDSNK